MRRRRLALPGTWSIDRKIVEHAQVSVLRAALRIRIIPDTESYLLSRGEHAALLPTPRSPCFLEVACQRELFALAWLPGARAVATMSLGDTHTRPREATAGKCQRTAAAQNNRAECAAWVEDVTKHRG